MPLVIDASITLAWCFEDEATERTDAILARVGAEGALVPLHWSVEVANVLLMAERRGRTTPELTLLVLARVEPLQIVQDDTPPTQGTILQLARTHRLTAYDAAYLELAIRRSLPLATLDGELRDACQRASVPYLP